MKVLHVLHELQRSGAEVMLRTAAPHWKGFGVQGHVLAKGAEVGPYRGPLEEAGYVVHYLPFDPPLAFAAKLFLLLRRERFDVVHVHSEHANFWIALLAKAAGVPRVVRTVHGAFTFTGWLRVKRGAQRLVLRLLGVAHVSVGETVQRIEQATFGNPTRLIRNWYDDARFQPPSAELRARRRRELGLADGDFTLVTVGNCAPVKNHESLLRALAAREDGPAFVYLHVGREEDSQPERALARDLGIESRCRFLGARDEVEIVLQAADLFVMPSRREAFSIAALEAVASGLPCLLSDVPGLRDLKESSGALFYCEATPTALAAALREIAARPREELREAALRAAKAVSYSCGVVRGAGEYHALYGPRLR